MEKCVRRFAPKGQNQRPSGGRTFMGNSLAEHQRGKKCEIVEIEGQTRGENPRRNPLRPERRASLGLGATASLAGAMNDVWWHRTWSSGGKLGKKQEGEYGSKKGNFSV